jgi:hypothetical protein
MVALLSRGALAISVESAMSGYACEQSAESYASERV